jgi:hypothetical protein
MQVVGTPPSSPEPKRLSLHPDNIRVLTAIYPLG